MEISDEQVCQDLFALIGRFKHELFGIAGDYQLTQVQLMAIYLLQQHGSLAMGEVANVLHCDPSNVTGIVDRLVAHKLVVRQENVRDRRAKTISLTPEGQRVVDKIIKAFPGKLGCNCLSASERQAIHSAVQKMLV